MIFDSSKVRWGRGVLGALALGAGALSAHGEQVCINSATTITLTQQTIVDQCSGRTVPLEAADIVVTGVQLEINGEHTIRSLTVQRNAANQPGIVTHSANLTFLDHTGATRYGTLLTVLGDVSVQGVAPPNLVASRIDLDGKGFPGGTGPGAGSGSANNAYGAGGAYGGAGANSASVRTGGNTYGLVVSPVFLGSGGGMTAGARTSSAGGGCFRMIVSGTARIDGIISANGQAGAVPNYSDGGGAGGAVWITANRIEGTGTIRANGGAGGNANAGGGGGGRISLESQLPIAFAGWQSCGGDGFDQGGAGTVYVRSGSTRGTLYLHNCNASGEATEFTGNTTLDMNVEIAGGALLGPAHGDSSLHLTILGNMTIQSDGFAGAPARGFVGGSGPGAGAGSANNAYAGGAGFGGAGANSSGNVPGGATYGSVIEPTSPGSGGGMTAGARPSSAGGGVFRLTVAELLTIDGQITADGQAGAVPNYADGGGSGGSLWISANRIVGQGSIHSNGGAGGNANAGGGGGGRVAIYTQSASVFNNWQACGGSDSPDRRGGAGTIYVRTGTGRGTLYLNNCGLPGEATEFTGDTTLDMNVEVAGRALLAPAHADPTLRLVVTGNMNVQTDGAVGAPFRGFSGGSGPGAGAGSSNNAYAAGGGYGGIGGNSSSGRAGGGSYGSISEPIEMGSGGGFTAGYRPSSAGGGVLRLLVGGTLTVNGEITSDGQQGAVPNYADGGGSGGSLWINANQIVGTGTIHANGGAGGNANAGGGGGGRIALYSCSQPPDARVQVDGGAGWQVGRVGTVSRGSNIRLDPPPPSRIVEGVPHDVAIDVAAFSTRPPFIVSYQWQRLSPSTGVFENLTEGQLGRFTGVTTRTLRIDGDVSPCGEEIYKCVLTDVCGNMPSPPVMLKYRSLVDLDDGSGTRNPDDAVTIDDLLYYLPRFATGDVEADLDDGTLSGTPDGGVSIEDLLFFLQHLYAGC